MQLTVVGVPLPQGSKSAFALKTGRVVVTDGKRGPALREWRLAIAASARAYLSDRKALNLPTYPLDGPISIAIDFYLPRPASAPKRVTRPAKKPDLDKLVRGVGDALAGIAYTQDSRIVEIWARKFFADGPPCVKILVKEIPAI